MQEVASIRNIALVGHSASGKTMLAEAILYKNGTINRFGKIEEGNTVSDFASDEVKRAVSINTSILNITSGGKLINFLDTPGYADFAGDLISALSAVDSVALVLSASSGVEVGSERCFNFAKERNLPVVIFVNKCDKENTNMDAILDRIKERFGSHCMPFNLPDGMSGNLNKVYSIFDSAGAPANIKPKLEETYKNIIDFAAESDDKLLERYLEGGQLSQDEISKGLRKSVREGNLIPVFFGSATKDQIGVE
ncbi:MAG: GTP-binding protein, partial [Candidatus Omnitrophica bacterium]|nr:GTP-binding protein [Candidatus Omnitrophota bacterium]